MARTLWRNAAGWRNIRRMCVAAADAEPGEELVRYFGAWEAPPNAFTEGQREGWYWRNVATLGAWAGPVRDRGVAIRNARDNSAPDRWL